MGAQAARNLLMELGDYDLENLTARIGLNTDYRTNIVMVGAVLVLAAATFATAEFTTHRRGT